MKQSSTLHHPRGLYTLAFTEIWERFSFYGMRALLILYLLDKVTGLGLPLAQATALYGTYTGMVYVTPLIGGYLADRFLGKMPSVFLGGILMALGHFALIFEHIGFFYAGLGLLAMGNGFFKPTISAMVGELYPHNSPIKDAGYTLFYMGINAGALLGALICGYLAQVFGWHWGFGAAGIGMLAGLLQLWFGRKNVLPHKDVVKSKEIAEKTPASPLTAKQWQHLLLIGIMAFFFMCFFMAFEQGGSSLNIFADQHMNRTLFGFVIPAAWFQSLNPLFIFILGPVLSWLWKRLAVLNREPSVPAKYAWGLFLLGCGFLIMAIGSSCTAASNSGLLASMAWLVLYYFFSTLGELLIAPVGLAMVSNLSPARYVGLLMGGWLFAMGIANKAAGVLAGFMDTMALAHFYLIFVALLWCSALVLRLFSHKLAILAAD